METRMKRLWLGHMLNTLYAETATLHKQYAMCLTTKEDRSLIAIERKLYALIMHLINGISKESE